MRPVITTRTHDVKLGETACAVQSHKSNSTQSVLPISCSSLNILKITPCSCNCFEVIQLQRCSFIQGRISNQLLIKIPVIFLPSLVCKIRSGVSETLFKPLNVTARVHEGRVEGRYSIEGSAEMPGFTFVVIHEQKDFHQLIY